MVLRGIKAAARVTTYTKFTGVVLLASNIGLGECTDNSRQRDQEFEAASDIEPSAIHWALAVILAVALFLGLMRVMRVLRKEDGFTPMRHAPEGMRPVQCGACHTMQHVTLHGRIFICFSCHSANRLSMEIFNAEEPQLVAASGPLRRFEFHREGDNYYKETQRLVIADSEAAELIAQSNDTATIGQNPSIVNASLPDGSGQESATPRDLEAGDNNAVPSADDSRPSPATVGRSIDGPMDPELISNPSICSKKSKGSICGGLPTCVVCLEEPGNMVLLPCAHGGVCDGCTTRIAQNRAQGGAHCPHCRSIIETIVKIHAVEGDSIKGVEFRIPMAPPR